MIEFSPFWRVQKNGWFGIFGWPCCNGVAGPAVPTARLRLPESQAVEDCFDRCLDIWVCLKIGYIPNYSHLIGIMIINHWV